MNTLHATCQELGRSLRVEARHVLLHAGEVARRVYFIEQGCLRLYLIDAKGRETSTQFFFEGDVVCSMESFLSGQPSALNLAAIEDCCLRVVDEAVIKARIKTDVALQGDLQVLTQQRLIHYANLYTSAIADSPTQRYLALKAAHQHLLERIPLHILAAYLGVSAVHLSRIRRKLKEAAQSVSSEPM